MGRKIDKIVAIHTEAIKELGKASIVQLANKINEIIDHLNEEEGWKREEGCTCDPLHHYVCPMHARKWLLSKLSGEKNE